jgi:sulfur carrier protein
MQIFFDGNMMKIPIDTTVDQLLALTEGLPEKMAIALNCKFLPKSDYPETILQPGDRIDIITPMQGG